MASIRNLHLQYRLWIAELNADINVLRIFDDYLADIKTNTTSADIIQQVSDYKNQFADLRKEMDELRHEMYLNKMQLAAMAKTPGSPGENIEAAIHHQALTERYEVFRKTFENFKKEFQKQGSKDV